jgi:hypothetical protein
MLVSLLLTVAALSLPPATPCISYEDPPRTKGPSLEGDVDSDGRADTVWTRARWVSGARCRASLHVRTAVGDLAVAVQPASQGGSVLAPPGLAGLARVDRRPGLEVALVPWEGASTTFVVVYALRAGRLVRLKSPLFGHGGSVANRSGVDCVRKRGALVVSSSASYVSGGSYRVVRRFFGLRRDAFVLKSTDRFRVPDYEALAGFPELANASQPFPSCTIVS